MLEIIDLAVGRWNVEDDTGGARGLLEAVLAKTIFSRRLLRNQIQVDSDTGVAFWVHRWDGSPEMQESLKTRICV